MTLPTTIGELRASGYQVLSVRAELRKIYFVGLRRTKSYFRALWDMRRP
jgi:biotin operon repressor